MCECSSTDPHSRGGHGPPRFLPTTAAALTPVHAREGTAPRPYEEGEPQTAVNGSQSRSWGGEGEEEPKTAATALRAGPGEGEGTAPDSSAHTHLGRRLSVQVRQLGRIQFGFPSQAGVAVARVSARAQPARPHAREHLLHHLAEVGRAEALHAVVAAIHPAMKRKRLGSPSASQWRKNNSTVARGSTEDRTEHDHVTWKPKEIRMRNTVLVRENMSKGYTVKCHEHYHQQRT